METAVTKLEVLFNKAEQDLTELSHKIDAQYTCLEKEQKTASSPTSKSDSSSGLVGIVTCVQKLRSELNRIAQDVDTLQQQQRQIVSEVQQNLDRIVVNVSTLSLSAGDDTLAPDPSS